MGGYKSPDYGGWSLRAKKYYFSNSMIYAIDITAFINQTYPEKEKVIDKLEERLFILSDGKLSVEAIILSAYMGFCDRYGKEYIQKKCIDLFHEIFSKNWGVAFAKSWDANKKEG